MLNRELVPEFGMYKISIPVKTGFDFLFAAADCIWINELIEIIQHSTRKKPHHRCGYVFREVNQNFP